MTHPTLEELVSYHYGEATADAARSIAAHAGACPQCQHHLESWGATGRVLDQWTLEEPRRLLPGWTHSWARWAAAAALILGVGFSMGRTTRPELDMQALKAALEPGLRQQLALALSNNIRQAMLTTRTQITQEVKLRLEKVAAQTIATTSVQNQKLVEDLAQTFAASRSQDQQLFLKTLEKLEERRLNDLRVLRGDLETVAVLTEENFNKAKSEIVRLAAAQPAEKSR